MSLVVPFKVSRIFAVAACVISFILPLKAHAYSDYDPREKAVKAALILAELESQPADAMPESYPPEYQQ